METIKKTAEYTIYKKRSGRYGIRNSAKKWINGDDKIKILVDAGLIKAAIKEKVDEAPQQAEATEAAAESAEDTTEEAAAE